MSQCLSTCLSICRLVFSVRLALCVSVHRYVRLALPFFFSVYSYATCRSVSLSVCLPACLSVCLSVCPSVSLSHHVVSGYTLCTCVSHISDYFVYCRNLCPNGTYSLGAQIKCSPCIPGSKCPSITEGPTICPPGYFSERNAEDCKLCEAGKQCADPACKHVNPKMEA